MQTSQCSWCLYSGPHGRGISVEAESGRAGKTGAARGNSRVPALHLHDAENRVSFSFGPWVPHWPPPRVSPGE